LNYAEDYDTEFVNQKYREGKQLDVSPERGHGQGCNMRLCVSAAAAAIVAAWPLSCLIASTFFLHPQGHKPTSND
jgi:hypothetical protein